MPQLIETPYIHEDFNIKIEGETILVSRSYEFTEGESVAFVTRHPKHNVLNVAEIHQQSIAAAIAHLKALSGQK